MPSRRQPNSSDHQQPPRLTVPRAEAVAKIEAQLTKGKEQRDQLRNEPVHSYDELKEAESAMWRWSDYTQSLLEGLFDNRSVADSTRMIAMGGVSNNRPLREGVESVVRSWGSRLNALQSVLERLDTYQEPSTSMTQVPASYVERSRNQTVFIVHGHDDGVKDAVARTLDRLGLSYTILHEEPNQGQTIIEKFERHADVGFAVVLLTPDDLGAPKDDWEHPKPRARQNVVFELGFFYAYLGRANVCALYKDVELPSDMSGVIFTPMDAGGVWRFRLASELSAAGLDVDLNKLKGM